VIFLFLVACTPSEDQIHTALEQTQTAQPTDISTSKSTKTPEYCPENATEKSLTELFDLHDDFAIEYNRGLEDYHVHKDVVVEITKIQKELSEVEVPLCLEYAKELLHISMQNAIDAFKENMSGSQVGYQAQLVELEINIELFYDEHDRISQCLPNCEP